MMITKAFVFPWQGQMTQTQFVWKKLFCRCKNFTAAKRIGTTGNPTPVRMPHAHPETFRQFIRYIYTGMVSISTALMFFHHVDPVRPAICTTLQLKSPRRRFWARSETFWKLGPSVDFDRSLLTSTPYLKHGTRIERRRARLLNIPSWMQMIYNHVPNINCSEMHSSRKMEK